MGTVVPIATLDETLHHVKLHVRVIRTWQGRGANAPVNFVLLDAQGGAIQGSIPGKDYRKKISRFGQGKLCELARFAVRSAADGFRAVANEKALSLSSYTIVYPLAPPLPNIPLHYFELGQLEDVGVSKNKSSHIMDVVARIVGFRPVDIVQGKGGTVRVMTLYIANEREFVMDVALWDDFVDKFDIPALIARSQTSPVVVACNSLQLREYNGRWSLKTFVGTQFHFDEDIPEIGAFRSKLPLNLPPIFHDAVSAAQCMQQFNVLTLPTSQPRRLTLLQLGAVENPSDSDVFECIAEITDVTTRFDWYYGSCPSCNRKIYDPDNRPICGFSKCAFYKSRVIPVPWYRFTVQVRDQTATGRFVLLGNQAETVVGLRPGPLITEQKLSPDDAPASLLAIIGKRFLFGISGKEVADYSRYRYYTVRNVDPVPVEELPLAITDRAESINPIPAGEVSLIMATSARPASPGQIAINTVVSDPTSDTPPHAVLEQHLSVPCSKDHVPDPVLITPSPGKRLPGDSSNGRSMPVRDVKRRLAFSEEGEGHLTHDVVQPASSSAKEKVP